MRRAYVRFTILWASVVHALAGFVE